MAKSKSKSKSKSTQAKNPPALKSVNPKSRSDRTSAPPGDTGEFLTTNQGVRISDNHNSLKAGPRGPSLLEDFVLREKITHFDHERIPERIVHARGAGAFGYFECLKEMSEFTSAGFLSKAGKRTPVLTRFSTVAGSRGSADTARDVRGFATKFYTDEGNFDLVGNNIPVFFIQDAMKFPDLIHAVKPEPDREIPQAQSAHDTFWDFVSLMPESTHMLFWVMSDRAIPRSYRMMEGFGVHSFRFVNAEGEASFIKFHWKPRLGIHGVTWEESLNLAGQDPDFHRRDLWDSIEKGAFPEWDFCVQIIPEKDEFKYSFDLLDPTKLVPEELVPVQKIGKMVLNRNPDNYFAEIEQVAFHPGHVVPGIDVSNDPLLQGRLFSYTDTQLSRLGGPNFHEIPVNRPLAPVNNNQRDGIGRQAIAPGKVAYEPNSIGGGCPFHSPEKMKGFVHFAERIDAHKVRARSESFGDHFSQARLFFASQSKVEKNHIRDAFAFELSHVEIEEIRIRMVGTLAQIDENFAREVAAKIGVDLPKNYRVPPSPGTPENDIVPPNRATAIARADDPTKGKRPGKNAGLPGTSPALSMIDSGGRFGPKTIATRKIACLIADGVDAAELSAFRQGLEAEGAVVETIAPRMGPVKAADGKTAVPADKSFDIATALHYDAVFVPSGSRSVATLSANGHAKRFVAQAFKHCKVVGGLGEARAFCDSAIAGIMPEEAKVAGGWVLAKGAKEGLKPFVAALKEHRFWDREAYVKESAI